MSDENRNMNDINNQQTAEQQAFSEEIRRRLAEPGSGKPTLDEFKVMVYKDREKRRKKRNALVACIVAAFIIGYLTYDDLVPEVGADKNPKETIQTEDGVIIEDGGYGSSVGEENVWTTEDWGHVEDAKKIYPQLVVPNFIPSKYSFTVLSIENIVNNDIKCEYLFETINGNEKMEIEILISEGGETSVDISDVSNIFNCNKGKIYIQEEENKAIMNYNDGIVVFIKGIVEKKDIIEIMENLYN